MKFSQVIFYALFISLNVNGQADSTQKIIAGRFNSVSQQSKPYVILISADGFRYDYATKYNAANLLRLSAKGVTAASMIPSFPSLTFPNHYSLVTGLYPSHHGLVDNSFYDATLKSTYSMSNSKKVGDKVWYGGMPLWVLAEKQQMLSASFYWVGSEAPIMDVRPTYYYAYNELIPINKRIDVVKQWLLLPEEERPHLITFYFPEVDHEGHSHGPDAAATIAAVQLIDKSIGRLAVLTDSLKLPVNFVFVSDHGMTTSDTTNMLPIPTQLKDTAICKWTGGSTMLFAYCKNKSSCETLFEQLKSSAKDYDVYMPDNTPSAWHYNSKEDRYHRLGDIIITAHHPKIFQVGKSKPTPGKHGYDPNIVHDMHATFMAWGPQIKKSGAIPSFENVNIYPFVAKILGLHYEQVIDGSVEVLGKYTR